MDVEMPDGTIIEGVPEGTTQSELQRRLSAYQQPQKPAVQPRLVAPQQAAIESVGEAGLNAVTGGMSSAAGGLAGLGTAAGNLLGLTDADPADVISGIQERFTYQPRTEGGKALSAFGGYLGGKLAEGADVAGGKTAEVTGSPALGAAVNTGIQALPAIFLRGRGTRTPSRPVAAAEGSPKSAPVPKRPARLGDVPPTIEELAAQSRAAYKRASDAGVNISPASFKGFKDRVNATLKNEGLDKDLHPKTTAALKRINETKGPVSLDQLETLRKIAGDARGAIDKADARLASQIIDDLDNYTSNISRKDVTSGDPAGFKALQEGRDLWSRKSKAEEIRQLVERAEISAPNFGASGMENALRTEFRSLAKNKSRMRRFSPEEQAAIKKVAMGGPMENALRMLGKFAPTGVVSTALSSAAGLVVGGGVGAVALPTAGAAARLGATRMTRANAVAAEELMRRGRPRNHLRPEELTENKFLEQMY